MSMRYSQIGRVENLRYPASQNYNCGKFFLQTEISKNKDVQSVRRGEIVRLPTLGNRKNL